MQRAVILLRVSDRNVRARQRFRRLASRLEGRLADTPVPAAYVVPGPAADELSLTRAVERAVAGGAAEVAVVPCEVEWKTGEWQDVPDTVQELARAHPRARFRLAPPLAVADDLLDVVANRCDAAWSLPDLAGADVDAMVDLGAQPPIAVATLRPGEAPQAPAPGPRQARPGVPRARLPAGRQRRPVRAPGGARRGAGPGAGAGHARPAGTPGPGASGARGAAAAPGVSGASGASGGAGEAGEASPAGAIKLTRTKCLGPCAGSPLLCVYPAGDFYWGMSEALLPRFVDEVLVAGGTLPGHTFRPGEAPREGDRG